MTAGHEHRTDMLQLCKVTEALFIANSRSACSDQLVQQEGITLCINVSRQQPFPSARVSTLRVPVYDDPNENLYKYFDRCADAIASEAGRGGRTVVYCKNGRSRSASICAAYLMRQQALSLRDAFQVSLGRWAGGQVLSTNRGMTLRRVSSGHVQVSCVAVQFFLANKLCSSGLFLLVTPR